jgi:hypothetical protein
MASSLRVRPVDDADGALEARRGSRSRQRGIVAQREQELRNAGVVEADPTGARH